MGDRDVASFSERMSRIAVAGALLALMCALEITGYSLLGFGVLVALGLFLWIVRFDDESRRRRGEYL